jgi:hypothetical protein
VSLPFAGGAVCGLRHVCCDSFSFSIKKLERSNIRYRSDRRRFGFSAGTEAAPITGAPAAHCFDVMPLTEPRGPYGLVPRHAMGAFGFLRLEVNTRLCGFEREGMRPWLEDVANKGKFGGEIYLKLLSPCLGGTTNSAPDGPPTKECRISTAAAYAKLPSPFHNPAQDTVDPGRIARTVLHEPVVNLLIDASGHQHLWRAAKLRQLLVGQGMSE